VLYKKEKKTSFPSGEIASKTERGRGGIARETKYSRAVLNLLTWPFLSFFL
jgi:hypothetical protein